MEGPELIADALGRIRDGLQRTLEGLTPEEVAQQPRPDCNSIGWLAWHLTRVQDHHISELMGQEQAWVSQGWHQRFGMAPDPENTGSRHTPEQVAALKPPDGQTLLSYYEAVLERTKSYLAGVSPQDLDKTVDDPRFQPPPTVGVRLVSIVSDNTQHAGQAAYLRGLMQGKGWLPY